MESQPSPLMIGTVLGGRFRLDRVLGRGGFGIAYLATDMSRNDSVVVKELAPADVPRDESGFLQLDSLGSATAHRLRRRFLEEAKLLARLNLRGVPNVRAYAVDTGTAYYVCEYFADAEPLDQILDRERYLSLDAAQSIYHQLCDTLAAVHSKGILHRDIKPANVLLRRNGRAILVDFGAAREWHADMTDHHTVLFTPGYAPLEQLSEKAKRGPATDVYGLCALVYTLLTGFAPTPATDRLNGVPLVGLRTARPDADPSLAKAIEAGLALHYEERPQSIEELLTLADLPLEAAAPSSLAEFDAKLTALKRLAPARNECPACGDVLREVKPLPHGRCPVCRQGVIRSRNFSAKLCPACRSGILHECANSSPLKICPACRVGILKRRRKGLLGRTFCFDCTTCEAHFEQTDDEVALASGGQDPNLVGTALEWSGWAKRLGRSDQVVICDGCEAQFDVLSDGQWQQVKPKPEPTSYERLYPEEWARVAVGLDPGCGTHVCSACEADYFVDGERITLLGTHEDPFGFADAYAGRLATWDSIRWLGAGKSSERRGPVCARCGTEFDSEGAYLRLERTSHRVLGHFVDQLQTLEDWHRMARGLPRVDEEAAFLAGIEAALVSAYRSGEIGFDDSGTIWRGPAARIQPEGGTGTFIVSPSEISFGGLIRKERFPLETLASARAEGDVLYLLFRGNREPLEYEIEEVELTAHLESGNQSLVVGAEELADRLCHEGARATAAN